MVNKTDQVVSFSGHTRLEKRQDLGIRAPLTAGLVHVERKHHTRLVDFEVMKAPSNCSLAVEYKAETGLVRHYLIANDLRSRHLPAPRA